MFQVLLSQVHRLRALVLLGRFLDMGSWAVDLALSVGIFPYVLKLLQTTSLELRATLVFIWAKILALDRSCQADLVKDNGHLYFLKYLESPDLGRSDGERAQAAFVLATVCHQHPKGQALCAAAHLPQVLIQCLRGLLHDLQAGGGAAFLAKWLCLCLGKVSEGMPEVCAALMREGAHDLLAGLLGAPMPELRAAAVYALGCLISGQPRRADLLASAAGLAAAAAAAAQGAGAGSGGGQATPGNNMAAAAVAAEVGAVAAEQNIALLLLQSSVGYDASPLVREELAVALARFVRGHAAYLNDPVAYMQDKIAAQQARTEQTIARLAARSSSNKSRVEAVAGASLEGGGTSVGSSSGRAGGGGAAGSGSGAVGEALGSTGVMGMAAAWAEPESLDGSFMSEGLQEGSSMALYCSVIELVLMLATDTAPRVAALGKRVLLLAGLDLAPIQSMWTNQRTSAAPVPAGGSYQGVGMSSGSASSGRGSEHQPLGGSLSGGLVAGSSTSVPLAGGMSSSSAPAGAGSQTSVSASLGSLTSKLVKGAGRNWRSGFTSSGAAGGGSAARTTPPSISSTPSSSSSPPSPNREPYTVVGYSRPPYVLRTASILQDMGSGSSSNIHASYNQQQQVQYGSSAGDLADGGGSRSLGHIASSSSGSLAGNAAFAGEELNPGLAGSGGGLLPASHVYRLSCEYFSRPMLDPQATAWRELEAPKLAPWISPPDIHRKTQRLREMEAARQRCHSVNNPKIREQVNVEKHMQGERVLGVYMFCTMRSSLSLW